MNFNEQKKAGFEELSNADYKYIGNYEMPESKTLADVDYVEISTQDGALEFKLCFKGNIKGSWNSTWAYNPKDQAAAILELKKHFGEDKIKSK